MMIRAITDSEWMGFMGAERFSDDAPPMVWFGKGSFIIADRNAIEIHVEIAAEGMADDDYNDYASYRIDMEGMEKMEILVDAELMARQLAAMDNDGADAVMGWLNGADITRVH